MKTVKIKDTTHKSLRVLQAEWELHSIDSTIQQLLPPDRKRSDQQ